MSQSRTAQITIDQLRNREGVVADLVDTLATNPGTRSTVITAPSDPLSVFGRKITGHDA